MTKTGAIEKFWVPTHAWRSTTNVRRNFLAVIEVLKVPPPPMIFWAQDERYAVSSGSTKYWKGASGSYTPRM